MDYLDDGWLFVEDENKEGKWKVVQKDAIKEYVDGKVLKGESEGGTSKIDKRKIITTEKLSNIQLKPAQKSTGTKNL